MKHIDEGENIVVAQGVMGNQVKYQQGDLLIGTDGAKSVTRKLIGAELIGSTDIQDFVSIHFKSLKLSELLRAISKADTMLYFIYSSQIVAVLVCHNYQEGQYVLQVPILPDIEDFNSFDEKDATFGREKNAKLTDIEIKTKSKWQMTNQIASKLRSQKGRVFLAGDSAHLFAPAGGFGLNSGFQDAHCLAHKLRGLQLTQENLIRAAVQYEKERTQIANQN